jgi:hypothetical protein
MTRGIHYDVATGMTAVAEDVVPLLAGVPTSPVDICRVAQALLVLPGLASAIEVPEVRLAERSIRSASDIIRALRALDDRPLVEPRSLTDRVVGTCRHFAVLSCALLRHRGVAARARCGFAAYFSPGDFLDHWIVEYWRSDEQRWVRIDPEILGFEFVTRPEDLGPDEWRSPSR